MAYLQWEPNAPVDPEDPGETTLCPRAGLEHCLSGRGVAFDLHLAGELEDTRFLIALSPHVLLISCLLFSGPWITQLFSLLVPDGEGWANHLGTVLSSLTNCASMSTAVHSSLSCTHAKPRFQLFFHNLHVFLV